MQETSCFSIRDGFANAFGSEVVIEPNMRTIQTMSLCEAKKYRKKSLGGVLRKNIPSC